MEIGAQQDDSLVENTLKRIALNQCCSLIFTVKLYIFQYTQIWKIQLVR